MPKCLNCNTETKFKPIVITAEFGIMKIILKCPFCHRYSKLTTIISPDLRVVNYEVKLLEKAE